MVELTEAERAAIGDERRPGLALAMRVVVEAAALLGARRLVPISSAHVDGCLYHGDAGVHFVERLRALGARVSVPTTCNVGSLDLLHPERVRASPRERAMAGRAMRAYTDLGCRPTWTCAPYQAGHRPGLGEHVAWGESNAVAFVNSVLGARTNRCGDFLDVCAAIAGRAPWCGLHLDEHRRATVRVDLGAIAPRLREHDAFFPVLGAWLGQALEGEVAVLDGLAPPVAEDRLKALGAGAAATGATALFHVLGTTPEAPDLATATGGRAVPTVRLEPGALRATRDALSTATGGTIDCVALGSPHFSLAECRRLWSLLEGRPARRPIYVCTRRDVLETLAREGVARAMEAHGVVFVVDTCIVVAPVLPPGGGVMMTASAKFAHYGPPNTGYAVVYGSLEECVASARGGSVVRDETWWA